MKRGNLLWVGSRMMLTEHRQLLNQRLNKEQLEEDIKLEIDEQQMEEWQQVWQEAVTNQSRVTITFDKFKKKDDHWIYC